VFRGDGPGKTVIKLRPASFEDNVDADAAGGGFIVNSYCTLAEMTIDGQGSSLTRVNTTSTLIRTANNSEFIYFINLEVTGQYSQDRAGTVVNSLLGTPAQFTLGSGHEVEDGDTIALTGHSGATFTREDLTTYNGNGYYAVSALAGDVITVTDLDGNPLTVSTAGTGGTVDNTTSRNFEGFGISITSARYIYVINCHCHHNAGTGLSIANGSLTDDWCRNIYVEGGEYDHNGWQGITNWGAKSVTIRGAHLHHNDKSGGQTEHTQNILWDGCISEFNGRRGFNAIGFTDIVRWHNCTSRQNGATDFAATFGAFPTPNDPASLGSPFTLGANYVTQHANFAGTPSGSKGVPRYIEIINCISERAPGKSDMRWTTRNGTPNLPRASRSIIVIDSPEAYSWVIMPNGNDPKKTVRQNATVIWRGLPFVQRLPLPPVSAWGAVSSATQAAPSGAYTSGLTTTAGAITTVNWASHGFSDGDVVWLEGFYTGDVNINRQAWTVDVLTSGTFTIPITTTVAATEGRGIDYKAELSGCTSPLARTITFTATSGSGFRVTLPWDRLAGKVRVRYKILPPSGYTVPNAPGDNFSTLAGFNVGFQNAAGGAVNSQWYPSIYHLADAPGLYQWFETDIRAEPQAMNSSIWRFGAIISAAFAAGWRMVIDGVGDFEASIKLDDQYKPAPPSLRERITIRESFGSSGASTNQIGTYGWGLPSGTITSSIAPPTGRFGITRLSTAATIAANATIRFQTSSSGPFLPTAGQWDAAWEARISSTVDAQTTTRLGLGADASASPPNDGIYFERLLTDTNWFAVCRASSTQTRTDMGIAASTSWPGAFKFRRVSDTVIAFSIGAGTEQTISNNVPTTNLNPFAQIVTGDAVAKSLDLDSFELNQTLANV
jgi:hypothetical protein